MMQRILFILLLILIFCSPAVVHADKPSNRTTSIEITNVTLGDSPKPALPPAEARTENAPAETMTPSYIAITYEIANTSTTKKLTLDHDRKSRLIDEFGNEYREIKAPDGYNRPAAHIAKNFPSLYPGEKQTVAIFFEAPIPAAKKLKFTTAANDLGLARPVELFIDIADRRALMPIKIKGDDQPALGIRIVDPPSGTILKQGDVVHIRVITIGDKPPQKIIVITLNTYYEDKSPAFENVYDLNVPLDQAPGNYLVNVIAEWSGTTPDNTTTLSDTLSFDVREAVPLPSL
jgi:hypothetical protein